MIKLENISTERLIRYVNNLSKRNELMKDIYNLLVEYEIYDYQKLYNLINDDCVKLSKEMLKFLNAEILEIKRDIELVNISDIQSEIFTYDMYEKSGINVGLLKLTDSYNNGDVLLYSNPFVRGGARINKLRNMSIEEIKYLSSHLSSYDLKNVLTTKRNFGIDTVKKVVDCVKFYEEQVLRQAKEMDVNDGNLFMLNKKEKDEIVESQFKEIVEYIIDNADVCVWGNLPSSQKILMIRTIFAVRGEQILQDRQHLINVISNYTTLSELEKGVVKNRTLDRFIVR